MANNKIDMAWFNQRLGGLEESIGILEDRINKLEAKNGNKKGKSS